MHRPLYLLPALALLATAAADPAHPSLPDAIRPAAEELTWLSIPWETDLLTATARAAAEDKPIFLWEMDGHPLGCV
jgi:hypothetical protein